MWGWAIVLGLAALAARRSTTAVAVAAGTDDVARAVAAALEQETDPNVLLDFAQKLRAAGRDAEATELGQRAIELHPAAAARAAIRPAAAIMLAQASAKRSI